MMYKSSLAVAIKNNGKVLREFNKDTVFLPFGSEYSILVKNLNTVRALVHITIDGQNMTKDGLVVNACSEVELERKITDNMNKGNKFKFIERNDAVEQHRGVKLEDGVIRIEYQYEKTYPTYLYYTAPNYWYGTPYFGSTTAGSGVNISHTSSGSITRSAAINAVSTGATSYNAAEPVSGSFGDFVQQGFNDAGITVPGSQSNQQFNTVSNFPLEYEKHVMIFKLLGETPDNEPIRKPVTVKAKPRCQTCNRQNKANAKFCSHCGTALNVYV